MLRKRPALLAEERRLAILRILRKERRLHVDDLAHRFKVSAVTLRSDLARLASQGHLVRSYGGALLVDDAIEDVPIGVKQAIRHAEKMRIAEAAARLVDAKQTIILDSGSTTAELGKALKRRNLGPITVITHALNIAQEFLTSPHVSVIMIGGLMRHVSGSFVGPQAERMLRECGAHHCFLGIDGLTSDLELSTPDVLEAHLNAAMIQTAEQTTVLADASKFGRRSLSVIGRVTNVKRIITDRKADRAMVDRIREQGVEVQLV